MVYRIFRSLDGTWPKIRVFAQYLSGSILFGLSVASPILPQASRSLYSPISISVFVSAFLFNALSFMNIARYIHYTLAFCFVVMLSSQVFLDHVQIHAQRRFIPSYMMALSFLTASWPSLLRSIRPTHGNETSLPRHVTHRPIYMPLVHDRGIRGYGSARSSEDGSMDRHMAADAWHDGSHFTGVSSAGQLSSWDVRPRHESTYPSEDRPYMETDRASRSSPGLEIPEDLDWQQPQALRIAHTSDSGLSRVTSLPRAFVPVLPWSAQELQLAFMHMGRPSSNAQSSVHSRYGSSLFLSSIASRESHEPNSEESSQPLVPRRSQRWAEMEAAGHRPYSYP